MHLTGRNGVQGVVTAPADQVPRLEVRSTLANDDCPGLGHLTAVELHAEVLRVGVPAVAGGSLSLLVGHGGTPNRESTGSVVTTNRIAGQLA